MFRTPLNNNSVPFLVSRSETTDLQRKLRCLNKILDLPKAKAMNLELSQPLSMFYFNFNGILMSASNPYTKEHRATIDEAYGNLKVLEDIIIRMVMKDEPIVEIIKGNIARFEANNPGNQ